MHEAASACHARPLLALNTTVYPRLRLTAAIRRLASSHFARNVVWVVVGSGAAQAGSFLSSVVLARILGREAFGEFALIQSTVTALTYLASLGLGLTVTKYISQCRETEPQRIGRVMGLCSTLVVVAAACFSVLVAAAAPALGGSGDHSGVTAGLRLSSVAVFFLTLTGYQVGILAGFEVFRTISLFGMICGLANPLLSFWGAARLGVSGAVIAQGLAAFLLWLLYEIAVRTECRRRGIVVQYRRGWEERSILARVSIPAAACGMVGAVAAWGGNAILARSRGYGELALFAAAGNMRSLVILLPSLVLRVVSPRLNHLLASRNVCRYRRAFAIGLGVNSGLASLGAILVFVAGHRFLRVFGKDFAGSDTLLALILASAVIEVAATNLYLALFASGRFWRNLMIISLWTAVLLAASAAAAPRYGAAGVAAAYLASWSVAAVIYALEAVKQNRALEVS